MVAAGDHIHAGGKDFRRHFGCDAVAAGRILAIGNDEIERVLFTQLGQERFDGPASGLAHDIADEEDFHAIRLIEQRPRASKSGRSLV